MHEDKREAAEGSRAEREKSFSRRALIRAGWVVPVVMAVTPVRKALGGAPLDLPFEDIHNDTFNDAGPSSPFGDTPFEDIHNDQFWDGATDQM